MPALRNITCDTWIEAPVDVCFDLARDVTTHCRTLASTKERVVPPGRIEGLLNEGDLVTFEARHFGVRWRLTARIVLLERPSRFVDAMEQGPFAALRHTHEFREQNGGTLMRDIMEWRSPWGPLGAVTDRFVLERYLRRLLRERAQVLKEIAESE